MFRTPVTPLAINNGNDLSISVKCTCMSHRPGIKNIPLASTICAPKGGLACPTLPTAVMRLPVITTVMSEFAGAPVISMTVTCVSTSARVCGLCACRRWALTAAKTINTSSNATGLVIKVVQSTKLVRAPAGFDTANTTEVPDSSDSVAIMNVKMSNRMEQTWTAGVLYLLTDFFGGYASDRFQLEGPYHRRIGGRIGAGSNRSRDVPRRYLFCLLEYAGKSLCAPAFHRHRDAVVYRSLSGRRNQLQSSFRGRNRYQCFHWHCLRHL